MKRVLVPMADGVEELEAVTIVDILRRADWHVVSVGIVTKSITASRGVLLEADRIWADGMGDEFDILAIPGGALGADALASDSRVLKTVQKFVAEGKTVAAICAGPLVLQLAGVLSGRRATCHPSLSKQLTVPEYLNERVVVDNQIITSQGAGTALEFALTIIRNAGEDAIASAIAKAVVAQT